MKAKFVSLAREQSMKKTTSQKAPPPPPPAKGARATLALSAAAGIATQAKLRKSIAAKAGPRGTIHGGQARVASVRPSVFVGATSREGSKEAVDLSASAGSAGEFRMPRRQYRLNDPQSRLTFLQEHPFFQDTSPSLRERLAPQMVKRSAGDGSEEILKQGHEPTGSMDYLFLTAPDVNARVEVLFDGRAIATLGGGSIFGQEVVFGVTKKLLFGIRVPAGATGSLWVIPRSVVQSLLQRDVHRIDTSTLRERAHASAVALLHNWFLQPTTTIRLRLFENAARDFKSALVEASEMSLYAEGATIQKNNEFEDSCICVFRGEADVSVDGRPVTRLSQVSTVSSWAAWWGVLEVLGVTSMTIAEVKAASDCIVWRVTPASLKGLRKNFSNECRLLDKVGMEHARLLEPCALQLSSAALWRGVDEEVLRELVSRATTRICQADELVFNEEDASRDLYFVARGRLSVRRLTAQGRRLSEEAGGEASALAMATARSWGGAQAGVPLRERLRSKSVMVRECAGIPKYAFRVAAHLAEGAVFGELTTLGCRRTRAASVVCDTICDLRIIPQQAVVDALEKDPSLLQRMLELAKASGFCMPSITDDWCKLSLFSGLSANFVLNLKLMLSQRKGITGQHMHLDDTFFVLVHGVVSIELDRHPVTNLAAPAVLGELAVVQPGSHNFMVARCHSFCIFLAVPTERLLRLFQDFPEDGDCFKERAQAGLQELRDMVNHPNRHRVATFESEDTVQHGNTEEDPDVLGEAEVQIFVEVFQKVFPDSDPRFCDFLVHGMERAIYFDGHEILKEGDEGNYAIIIQRGSALVEVGGVRVGEVKEGGLIGESVLLGSSAVRTATVRAVGMVSAFTLAQAIVLEALEMFPEEKKRIESMVKIREQANKVLTGADPATEAAAGAGGQSPFAGGAGLLGQVARRGSCMSVRNSYAGLERRGSVAFSTTHSRRGSMASAAAVVTAEFAAQGRRKRILGGHGGAKARGETRIVMGGENTPKDGDSGSSLESDSEDEEKQSSTSKSTASWRTSLLTGSPRLGSAQGRVSTVQEAGGARKQRQQHIEWASRRLRAQGAAGQRRARREAQAGLLVPLVPSDQGYRPPENSAAASPWGAVGEIGAPGPAPWKLRLQRAQGLYLPPVWHESFGW